MSIEVPVDMEGEEQHHPDQRRVRGGGSAPGTFSGRPVRGRPRCHCGLAGGYGSQAGPGFAAVHATARGAARSGASAVLQVSSSSTGLRTSWMCSCGLNSVLAAKSSAATAPPAARCPPSAAGLPALAAASPPSRRRRRSSRHRRRPFASTPGRGSRWRQREDTRKKIAARCRGSGSQGPGRWAVGHAGIRTGGGSDLTDRAFKVYADSGRKRRAIAIRRGERAGALSACSLSRTGAACDPCARRSG